MPMIRSMLPRRPVEAGLLGLDALLAPKTLTDEGGLLNWDHEFPNIDKAEDALAPTYEKTVKITEGP